MNILILFQVALGQTVSHRYRLDHPEILAMCVNNIHVLAICQDTGSTINHLGGAW